jgi:hypothetical protein
VYGVWIPEWNDEPDRMLEDVILTLKTVAAEQEARGR